MSRQTASIAVFFAAFTSLAAGQSVRIMTQNMDAGTDLGYILALYNTAPKLAVDLTWAEVIASKVPQRANLIAGKIAAEKPDIVALQEAELWRVGLTPATANFVVFDQIELLRLALAAYGVPYQVVAINNLSDVALPATLGAVRLTDRNALLVRVTPTLHAPAFRIANIQNHVFSGELDIAGIRVQAGWIEADVYVGTKPFHFATTHLISTIEEVPLTSLIQEAQIGELIAALQTQKTPVIMAGDFNSDANLDCSSPASPVCQIETAGYTDVWKVVNPSDPGLTNPFYEEDQPPPTFFASSKPTQRIDAFFSKGASIVSAERILAPTPFGLPDYGSDHAGVLAIFNL